MWWRQAQHDLDGARSLRENGFYDLCAMMCQQAAEKAVKAIWIDVKSKEPPKTHWIERLAVELGAPSDVIEAGKILVGDYTAARYPDISG